MSLLTVSIIVFMCIFGSALLGMLLATVIPKHHVSPDTRDVVKTAMATVATLAALVLGLLTADAKTGLDQKEEELRRMATQVILLDRSMAEYGPQTQDARALLKPTLAARISQIWGDEPAGEVTTGAIAHGAGIETIQQKLLTLSPQNDAQRWLQSKALQVSNDIMMARWSVFQQIESRIHWPFLIILVFWLAVVFTSVGLFAPRNAIAVTALFFAALSIAGSIYLILAMDQPYSGIIKISSSPLRAALEQLGR